MSIQYRLRPDLGITPLPDLETAEKLDLSEGQAASLDAYDDAVAAVAWMVDHAEDLRIDPSAIIANGPSAGGATAWHLAWMQGSKLRPDPSGVAAAVSVSGAPFEFTTDTHEPLAVPSPGDRPVIDFHGTADTTIGIELAQQPCSHAAAAGVRCDLVPYEGIGHPGLDPQYLTLLGDIEKRTLAFIAEVVLSPLGYMDQPPGTPAGPDQPAPGPAEAPPAVPVAAEPTFTG